MDESGNTRIVEKNIKGRENGVKRIVELAQAEAAKMPNKPTVDQSGVNSVCIYIGVYRLATYRLAGRLYEYPHDMAEVKANEWEEVTYEHFNEMLCCLPPEKMEGPAFAVGEPSSHLNDTGEATFDCYIQIGNRYFGKHPLPLSMFDVERFKREVAEQHNLK
jgi:hypothetical protein